MIVCSQGGEPLSSSEPPSGPEPLTHTGSWNAAPASGAQSPRHPAQRIPALLCPGLTSSLFLGSRLSTQILHFCHVAPFHILWACFLFLWVFVKLNDQSSHDRSQARPARENWVPVASINLSKEGSSRRVSCEFLSTKS